MTNNEIIEGLKFTMDMCLFNPVDGSKRPISMLNDMDKITYNACEGAIKALEQESITWIVGKDNCQVAVRNMSIDKMQKICAVIGEEEQQPCEDCISRKEVISEIDRYIDKAQSTGTKDDFISFQELVVKQLPSVTPSYNSIKTELKPCEDAISREQVLYEAIYYADRPTDTFIKDVLKQLPPVKPQQKTGHWISQREHCENLGVLPSGLGAYEWCSNCDCGIDVKEFHRNYYNFCPNCGADMRGER